MRAKKEYLILAIIIIAAGLYLAFHKKDQTQYQLPEISKIERDAVTRLEIMRRGDTIDLAKKGDRWLIAPLNYPADGAKVKSMLFALEDLALTDLVSESKAYARYQLDDSQKITVKAWAADKVLLEFDIGKEAATYQHTFIRLPANPNVYHARGDFRRKFAENATDLRDREVLAFDPDALEKIRVTAGPHTLALRRAPAAPQPEQAGDKPAGPPKSVWLGPDNQSVDQATLDSFLSAINNLNCENYLEGREKDEFENPVFEVVLAGKQVYTLSVFKKETEKDTALPAISSYNAYPFTLSNDRLENWLKTVATLAGKEAKPEEK